MVKTKVLPSKIHGLGLFADEFIAKGTVIWQYHELDRKFTEAELAQLPNIARELIDNYCYHSDVDGTYVLCFDDARFINHSPNANTETRALPDQPEGLEVAKRDIQPGEEIVCDCREFDVDCASGRESYAR